MDAQTEQSRRSREEDAEIEALRQMRGDLLDQFWKAQALTENMRYFAVGCRIAGGIAQAIDEINAQIGPD